MAVEEKIFQKELRVFQQHKHEWLQSHAGEFAVIGGQTLAGFYPDYESGLRAGLQKFGLRAFLVKQIFAVEPVYHIY